jgi:hypothetical protein
MPDNLAFGPFEPMHFSTTYKFVSLVHRAMPAIA